MSKPTDRQKAIIEAIRMEMDYWTSSNDIHSPSHGTSIEFDMFANVDDRHLPVNGGDRMAIEQVVNKLHMLIRNMDPCPIRAEEQRKFDEYHKKQP